MKSVMKRREYGEKTREFEECIEVVEWVCDVVV